MDSKKTNKYFLVFFTAIFSIFTLIIIYNTWSSEMNHAFNYDSPLYWTVGKGMLNGIKPYSGLYENKPVGIFLISALSFALTDDITICNLFSFLCLMIIAFTPVLCILTYCKQTGVIKNKHKTLLYTYLALVLGLLLMKYCEFRGGAFQTESMGTAFVGLYFWAIMHIHWERGEKCSKKQLIIWSIIAGFFVMCGVMFKEPFVLLSVAGSLFMVSSVRDFISKTVIPTFIGGVLTLGLLLLCGVLPEYFTIYLKNMFGNHLTVYGSPFFRMLQFDKLAIDLEKFSTIFSIIIVLGIIILLLNIVFNKKVSSKVRLWRLIAFVFALFSASFAVGLGGQYFSHHYIFAAPFYMILIILSCQMVMDWSGSRLENTLTIPHVFSITYNTIILPSLALLVLFLPLNQNLKNSNAFNISTYTIISQDAAYVDALLDYYGVDTYQYLGFNSPVRSTFYSLTRHSPKGPVFVQDGYNFEDENTWFSQNLLKQLSEVDIVIVSSMNTPAINDKIQEILDTEFTTEPENPYTETDMPESFEYEIYYRIK